MSLRAVEAVARWEYKRFAKPRDLVLGALSFAVMFGVYGFVSVFLERRNSEPRDIAVSGAEQMGLESVETLQRFRLRPDDRELGELQQALSDKEFDALLVVSSRDEAELRVREERKWQEEFITLLVAHRQAQRPREIGLAPETLAALTSPVTISRLRLQESRGPRGRAGSLTVLIVVGTMLLGLFTGFSYVFVAITSEKTQHVTESVLSAITPQQWVDGKILGLTLVVLVNVLCYGVGYLIYKAAAVAILDVSFDLPAGIGDPMAVIWLVLFALLGFGFWFTLFAVVAATISDPNTSGRSALLFLPFLPLSLTLAGLDQPDALWMRVLSLLPGISPTAMPVRLLRGDPSVVEILLSLGLLATMVAVFRRAAGRVFGVSMLMTRKEPSWRELWRWLREA
jgi:ABC-2 type transport system permease protein